MFKRVEKRRIRRKEEEELGLDEDMKEIFGMHETDSDESNSDEGSSESDTDGEEGGNDVPDAIALDEELNYTSGSEAQEEPTITIQEALRDPVYVLSLQPTIKGCIVCPGKLLKSATMVDFHRKSNAHERRVKQFKILALRRNPNDMAWDVLPNKEEPQTPLTPSGPSKRAEKRKMRAEFRKVRRNKKRDNAKAKEMALLPSSDLTLHKRTEPPKKKQKVDILTSSPVL